MNEASYNSQMNENELSNVISKNVFFVNGILKLNNESTWLKQQ